MVPVGPSGRHDEGRLRRFAQAIAIRPGTLAQLRLVGLAWPPLTVVRGHSWTTHRDFRNHQDLLTEALTPQDARELARTFSWTGTESLRERFGWTPFTVYDGRSKEWRDEEARLRHVCGDVLGRADDLVFASAALDPTAGDDGFTDAARSGTGTSRFSPLLAFLIDMWFMPPGGSILDPFAGGVERGLLAGIQGRSYTGLDISLAQLTSNRELAAPVIARIPGAVMPQWIEADATRLHELGLPRFSGLLTCPPYHNLERFNPDDPRDLSNMSYPAFLDALEEAMAQSTDLLVDDSFSVWVIGDVRDERGCERGLPSDLVNIARRCGLNQYNHGVLLDPLWTAPRRAPTNFATGKWTRTHQMIYVFVKGDGKRAYAACHPQP